MTIARALRRLFARVPASGLPPVFTAAYGPPTARSHHRAVLTLVPRVLAPEVAGISAPDRPGISAP